MVAKGRSLDDKGAKVVETLCKILDSDCTEGTGASTNENLTLVSQILTFGARPQLGSLQPKPQASSLVFNF